MCRREVLDDIKRKGRCSPGCARAGVALPCVEVVCTEKSRLHSSASLLNEAISWVTGAGNAGGYAILRNANPSLGLDLFCKALGEMTLHKLQPCGSRARKQGTF